MAIPARRHHDVRGEGKAAVRGDSLNFMSRGAWPDGKISYKLHCRCDPGRGKLRADAKFEMRVAKRRLAALEAARDERLHSEAEEVRSVASESRTVTTAKAKAAAGTRPITSFLKPQ